MIRFIRNIPWKDILVIVLLGALAIGAVVGISSAVTNKTKTVSSLKFERGAIDSTGAFTESDTSIYTADYIECQGLRIEPDFDATGTYQVFYYDNNKQFVAATEVMKTSEMPVYDKADDFALAKYCKIVITPDTPLDDDGYVVEDYKIKFYEVNAIARKFTITVNKDQDYTAKSIDIVVGRIGGYYGENKETFVEQSNVSVSKIYDLEKCRSLCVTVPASEVTRTFIIQFFDANGNNLDFDWIYPDSDELNVESWIYNVAVPRGAVEFSVVLCNGYETQYEIVLVS